MSQFKSQGFADRRKAADEAKARLLRKFADAPKQDDPEVIAKRLAREAIASARDARNAARELEKQQKLAEEAALQEAAALAKLAEESEIKNRVSRVIADEATRKAERDRRYEARKARKN